MALNDKSLDSTTLLWTTFEVKDGEDVEIENTEELGTKVHGVASGGTKYSSNRNDGCLMTLTSQSNSSKFRYFSSFLAIMAINLVIKLPGYAEDSKTPRKG